MADLHNEYDKLRKLLNDEHCKNELLKEMLIEEAMRRQSLERSNERILMDNKKYAETLQNIYNELNNVSRKEELVKFIKCQLSKIGF